MDITELVLAFASAVVSLALPFALGLLRKHTGIVMHENDRKALDEMLGRAVAYGVSRVAGPDGRVTYETRTRVGEEALAYAVRNSPDLVRRLTGGASHALDDRIDAQIAKDFINPKGD